MLMPWNKAVDALAQPLIERGLVADHAAIVAEITARTIGMGITTHGLPAWRGVRDAIGKRIAPRSRVLVQDLRPATARIDASAVAPQVALWEGMRAAISRAKTLGVATVGVHHAGWVGALSPYLVEALAAGCPAMITGQSSACADCAPIGGLDPLFSTNPLGMCYGDLTEGMIADFSTAAMAMGKVRRMQAEGERAPEAWFREADGAWTDDPQAMARGGSLAFSGGRHGGHRGYALSLWTEAMAALAGGNAHDASRPGAQHLMITVHAPVETEAASLAAEIRRWHALVRSNRPEDPARPIRLPGERALAALARARIDGLEIETAALAA